MRVPIPFQSGWNRSTTRDSDFSWNRATRNSLLRDRGKLLVLISVLSLKHHLGNRDERSTLFFLAVRGVRGPVLDSQPLDHVYEIRHKARDQTLQGCRVAAQDELVDDPRLVELLDHWNRASSPEYVNPARDTRKTESGCGLVGQPRPKGCDTSMIQILSTEKLNGECRRCRTPLRSFIVTVIIVIFVTRLTCVWKNNEIMALEIKSISFGYFHTWFANVGGPKTIFRKIGRNGKFVCTLKNVNLNCW